MQGGAERRISKKLVDVICQRGRSSWSLAIVGNWLSLDMCCHHVCLLNRADFEFVLSFQTFIPVKGCAPGKKCVDSYPVDRQPEHFLSLADLLARGLNHTGLHSEHLVKIH